MSRTSYLIIFSDRGYQEGKIGFHVTLSKGLSNPNKQATVKFDQITTNKGNYYDSSSGEFIAKTSGLYYFSWTVLVKRGQIAITKLMRNNEIIAFNHAGARGLQEEGRATQSTVLELKQRDHVYIKVEGNNQLDIVGENWSVFVGFKI